MSKYEVIIVSKDDQFKLDLQGIDIDNHEINVQLLQNNKLPLTTVYNHCLYNIRARKNADFLIMLHADVQCDFKHLIQHIEQCKDKYDVMGLCGTSVMNVSQSPLNWWTGSNPTPTAKWGCVTHGELGNRQSFFSSDRANITDHEVACIDGLCIIFGPKAIKSELKFDEIFTFDFYDTDISFQTIMKYNMKLGVLVEMSLQHYSVGRSILTPEFLKHEIDFRKKWNLEIPENSPINKLINQAVPQ